MQVRQAVQESCLPPPHLPTLTHLRQGHGRCGRRAQAMCHRHRQEALLAVLAAGIHGWEPGAHGAWGWGAGGWVLEEGENGSVTGGATGVCVANAADPHEWLT